MAIQDLDEQVLVRAHQAGDEHAFGQIVRSQHRALYAHAYRKLGNHEAAEDAVQDTLLRAYRALPSFDGDLRLRAWLHRILTNVCYDESNRRRRQIGLIERLEAQPVELEPDPGEEAVLHDTVRVMSDALAELPESYREALVLRYVDGLSFRDVADTVGITEENARARVHRGRLALHKVLARVTLLIGFLIPGLRRGAKAIDTGGDAVASTSATEHTVSLSTQLASHVYQAAPVINRVAAEGSSMVIAKTSVVATAVAAVAAVAAPMAAYRVYDTTKTPSHPPAAVAPPAQDHASRESTTTTLLTVAGDDATSTDEFASPTSTTSVPPSAARPFAGALKGDSSTSSTTSPPTTAPAPNGAPGSDVHGTIGGESFDVTGQRPDFQLSGPAELHGSGDPVTGTLSGSIYVADAVGGDAIAELTFTAHDGTELRVRFRGTLDREDSASSATTWTMSGAYSIPGGKAWGLPETGTSTVVFKDLRDSPSSLTFDLRGQQTQDQ